jgi:nitric oxide reductase activation protein
VGYNVLPQKEQALGAALDFTECDKERKRVTVFPHTAVEAASTVTPPFLQMEAPERRKKRIIQSTRDVLNQDPHLQLHARPRPRARYYPN